MSKNRIDIQALEIETQRYDGNRLHDTFRRIGSAALEGASDDAIYDAGELFDEEANQLFDPENVYGYHLFSVEAGRLSLSSELETDRDSEGNPLPHTVLAAWISSDGKDVEISKFRQTGHKINKLDVFPDDWHIMNLAIEELARINQLIETPSSSK